MDRMQVIRGRLDWRTLTNAGRNFWFHIGREIYDQLSICDITEKNLKSLSDYLL